MWAKALRYFVIYVLSVGALILFGFGTEMMARRIALDVLRLQDYWDRSTYSFLEALYVIAIYLGSAILAVPITRRVNKFLGKFKFDSQH